MDETGLVGALMPEGTAPPDGIPRDIFDAALTTFLAGRRLDMQALAADLGVSRSTLYRKVHHRDQVLSAVIWYLSRHAMKLAITNAEALQGIPRLLSVMTDFMTFVHSQSAFQRFLDAEPEAALRVMTSQRCGVQPGLVAITERALRHEEAAGAIELTLDAHTLAYVIVRIGETFMYGDVIADNEPDIPLALDVIGRLLRGRAPIPS